MTGRLGQRSGLPPTSHAAIDQARVARRAVGGAESQPLHHPGPVALDQCISASHQRQRFRQPRRVLQVERHDGLAAPQRTVLVAAKLRRHGHLLPARNDDDLRPHVGQHPARQRAGANPFKLNDANSVQRQGHAAGS
ncbi:hypothetical protein D3C85_1441670 [compost metagenome]